MKKKDISITNKKKSVKPRTSMIVWAVICFFFATLYGIIAVISDIVLLAMTAFMSVLGIMFVVLAYSPKDNPFVLGKAKAGKKGPFVAMCIALAFLVVAITAALTNDNTHTHNSNLDNTNSSVPNETDTPKTIPDFAVDYYNVPVGEIMNFKIDLQKPNLSEKEISICVANTNVIKLNNVNFTGHNGITILTFSCTSY